MFPPGWAPTDMEYTEEEGDEGILQRRLARAVAMRTSMAMHRDAMTGGKVLLSVEWEGLKMNFRSNSSVVDLLNLAFHLCSDSTGDLGYTGDRSPVSGLVDGKIEVLVPLSEVEAQSVTAENLTTDAGLADGDEIVPRVAAPLVPVNEDDEDG